MTDDENNPLKVAVVGACASGKSALVDVLRQSGYEARHVAQEHSFVPYMWQRITRPDILIYLDVTYDKIMARRPKFDFKPDDLTEQQRRLSHARQHCDLYLDTSGLTTAEVQEKTLDFLNNLTANDPATG
jgi:deoxyadenosine/deoxycytidine kinase